MGFIAGQYTATFNSLDLGQTADGFRLNFQFFKRMITGDKFADTPQDGIYRGAEMHIAYRLLQYDAAAVAYAIWPYDSTIWDLGLVGKLDVGSSLVKQLVLTAVAGTPAQATPASLTMDQVILAEGFPIDLLFAPDLREIPMRQRVYPNATTGVFATQV